MARKLKQTILGIAIALVLVFFWGYLINTVYESPDSDDYCRDIDFRINVESCDDYIPLEIDGRNIRYPKECFCEEINTGGEVKCEAPNPEYESCMQEYYDLNEKHERNSFVVLVILGLISIFLGGFRIKAEAVSTGVMGGGVLTLIFSALRYWGSIQDYARLVILAVALVVLIWIGYKKLK